MTDLPSGTVTFLFTDVEGSTRMWETDRDTAGQAISRHMSTSGEEIARAGGAMFKTTGDGVYAAFPSAPAALRAALAMQVSFTTFGPPVRMALHTGSAVPSDGDYFGPALNRTARLLDAASGGQVVVSLTTEELARDELPDGAMLKELGRYRFRDLTEPVRVFQLVHPDIGVDFPPLRTLDARPDNLPLALTSFVGRERELAQVEELLDQTRLLTLVGVGGSGKTRLAIQAASAVADRFGHGVWMVELARLSDPELVAPTVASTLGVPEQPGRSTSDVLGDALSGRSLLLILDNCEHLIGAVATLADALLRSASGLTVLATSREGLGIAGEMLWQVPPLDASSEAIELFVQRARAVKPGYEPDQDREQIAQVCARLDGMPLAIELAAARMRALSAGQIADRLDDRFKLLTGGSRTALPRQQTLEAAVAWSFDLLSTEEKVLFARLSVFAGPFDLEAAETVCGGDPLHSFDVLDLLARLVDKSLVLVQGDRYRLLETIRSYARAQLADTGQAQEVRHAHARHFRDLVERAAEQHLPDLEYFDVVGSAVDNLRAAFAWFETAGGEVSAARMTQAMTLYWMARAVGEGRQWADRVLAMEGPAGADLAGVRGLAAELAGLQGDVELALEIGHQALGEARATGDERAAAVALEALASFLRGDPSQAQAAGEEALQLYESIGDTFQVARLRLTMALAGKYSGDYQRSADRFEQALTVFRQGHHAWHTAWDLVNLGHLKYILGKPEQALDDLGEALSLMRRTGDARGASAAQMLTGRVLWSEGRRVDAWAAVERSLELGKEVGSRIEVARSLDLLGRFSADMERHARAARLLGAGSDLVSLGVRWTPFDQAWLEDGVARVREAMGGEAFHGAWTEGTSMSLDEAVAYALAESEAPNA